MAKTSKSQTQQPEPSKTAEAPVKLAEPKANLAMTNRGFVPQTMEEAWRLSEALAQSGLVPDTYKGKPRDCLIALDLAGRLGVSWLAIMQSVYSVHGRLGMESKLVASLINTSGLFTDPLDYEIAGNDPDKTDYKVRAFATRKSTGKVLYGPWITWKMVSAEGWDSKSGSKWKTIADVMFHYRAASWFANRHCPEVKMGMMTTEEAAELPPSEVKRIDCTVVKSGVEGLKERLAERGEQATTQDETEPQEPQEPDNGNQQDPDGDGDGIASEQPDPETQAKAAEQKEKLMQAEGMKAPAKAGSNLF